MKEWPSIAELEAMPRDILSQWYWRNIAAMTPEHQALVQHGAVLLNPPRAVPPVYRFIEPVEAAEIEAPKPIKKATPEPAKKAVPASKPEEDSLALFKSLFR